jgi:hypothetical protein
VPRSLDARTIVFHRRRVTLFPASATFSRRFAAGLVLATAFGVVPTVTVAAAKGTAPWTLDDFGSAPGAAWAQTAAGAPDTPEAVVYKCESGLAQPPGGVRDTYHGIYKNPIDSVSAVGVGNGRLTVAQGTGTIAETLISYGAFTRTGCDPWSGGPGMRLDLSAFRALKLVFAGAEHAMNINVVYYTSAPLAVPGGQYYTGVGLNVAPSAPGEALDVLLPAAQDPTFNWRQVDGIVVIINRSGPIPHTSYTLDRIEFVGE